MTGDYFATCDDDDSWLPNKLSIQLMAMKQTGCKMSSTAGFSGSGIYNPSKKYKLYNTNSNYNHRVLSRYRYRNRYRNVCNVNKNIWDYNFLKIQNCIIACSVIIHKDIVKKIGNQLEIRMGGTKINGKVVHIDYEYWLRALKYTNCVNIDKPCVYYDSAHGNGKNY